MLKNLIIISLVCCFSHHALSEIVLIAGASKITGVKVAETLVSDVNGNYIVYAGLKPSSRRDRINALLAKYPTKMRIVDLDANDHASLVTATKTIISREGRLDSILNFGEKFAPHIEAMLPNMRPTKSARILEVLSNALYQQPELLERFESI